MTGLFSLTFFSLFISTTSINPTIFTTSRLPDAKLYLHSRLEDLLGFEEVTKTWDGVPYNSMRVDGDDICRQQSLVLSSRVQQVKSALLIARVMTKSVISGRAPPFFKAGGLGCCVKVPGLYHWRFNEVVGLIGACGRLPGGEKRFINDMVVKHWQGTVKKLDDKKSKLKDMGYQFIASTQGQYYQFPAARKACDGNRPVDPSIQPWYNPILATSRPKRVVIIPHVGPNLAPPAQGAVREAFRLLIDTFNPQDQIALVKTSSFTPAPGCDVTTLRSAVPSVARELKAVLASLRPGPLDLKGAVQTAWQMLATQPTRKVEIDLMFLVTSEKFPGTADDVLRAAYDGRVKAPRGVHVMTWGVGAGVDKQTADLLLQLADQDTGTLSTTFLGRTRGAPAWPATVKSPAAGPLRRAPVGQTDVLSDAYVTSSTDFLAKYYTMLPPDTTASSKEIKMLGPFFDDNMGLLYKMVTPVPDKNSMSIAGVIGNDLVLTSLLASIASLNIGKFSYGFIADGAAGVAVGHSKLPGDTRTTITPAHALPGASSSAQDAIMKCGKTRHQLQATEFGQQGGVVHNATAFVHDVLGTPLCVVLVLFDEDSSVPTPNPLHPQPSVLHHRVDVLRQAPTPFPTAALCFDTVRKETLPTTSVVKLAPWAYTAPELNVRAETASQVIDANMFINNKLPPGAGSISGAFQEDIHKDVKITEDLNKVWDSKDSNMVFERMFCTRGGLCRVYPGRRLLNTRDPAAEAWYGKASVSQASLIISASHYRGETMQNNSIVVSKAVPFGRKSGGSPGSRGVYGVLAADIGQQQLLANVMYMIPECNSSYSCHVFDDEGNIVGDGTANSGGYLAERFSWVAAELITAKVMQATWCLDKSSDLATFTYRMAASSGSRHSDGKGDSCKEFFLANIEDTNLHILVLNSRKTLSCSDRNPTVSCSSTCSSCNPTSGVLQCPCSCDLTSSCSSSRSLPICQDSGWRPVRSIIRKPARAPPLPYPSCSQPCVSRTNEASCLAGGTLNCTWIQDTPGYSYCGSETLVTTSLSILPPSPVPTTTTTALPPTTAVKRTTTSNAGSSTAGSTRLQAPSGTSAPAGVTASGAALPLLVQTTPSSSPPVATPEGGAVTANDGSHMAALILGTILGAVLLLGLGFTLFMACTGRCRNFKRLFSRDPKVQKELTGEKYARSRAAGRISPEEGASTPVDRFRQGLTPTAPSPRLTPVTGW